MTMFDSFFPATVVDRLGWVLVHSVWQLLLAALVAMVLARGLRRSTAAVRYWALLLMLAVMIAAPVVTWCRLGDDVPVAAVVDVVSDGDEVGIVSVSPPSVESEQGSFAPVAESSDVEAQPPLATSQVPRVEPPGISETLAAWRSATAEALRPWLGGLVLLWCVGVIVFAQRPLLSWFTVRRLRRVGVSRVPDGVQQLLEESARRLGLVRAVQVLESTLVNVPVVVGYFRPMILLPLSLVTKLPADQLEAILAHELAHIRRHDYFVNLVQTLVETVFFYHPAAWWLSRRIRAEREHCCDDLVVAALGNRVEYGRALLAVAELRTPHTPLALGANDGSLLSRVRRIVGVDCAGGQSAVVRLADRWTIVCLGTACTLLASMVVHMGTDSAAVHASSATLRVPDHPVAELPNGMKVELVGVAEMKKNPKEWWSPDGTALDAVPEHSQSVIDAGATYRPKRAVVRVHGATSVQDVITNYSGVRTDFARTAEEDDVRCDIRVFPDRGKRTGRVEVGVATEPLSPVRVLDSKGQKIPRAEDAPADHIAEDIEVDIVVGTKSRNRPSDGEGTAITFVSPVKGSQQFDLDLKLIDKDGNAHDKQQSSTNGSAAVRHEITYWFDIPFQRVARFEYRMRLYRHWVTFDNVSLQPGQTTDVRVRVESLPLRERKAEDGTRESPVEKPVRPGSVRGRVQLDKPIPVPPQLRVSPPGAPRLSRQPTEEQRQKPGGECRARRSPTAASCCSHKSSAAADRPS